MKSLNDILWGDSLEDSNSSDSEGGVVSDVMPNAMNQACMAMCCTVGTPCYSDGTTPCIVGYVGCK